MADPQPLMSTVNGKSGAISSQLATTLGTSPLKCCCGSLECVFLRHNNAILDNVEKDVHQAARMGQALLARHESYMADAERDRNELTARIEQLEGDNKALEAMNSKMIAENRDLVDQLEALNTTITDSEAHIKSLEATLLSSQQTIRRLEADTTRAEALERQIASLEEEQAELQGTLCLSREEARSATSRWKRAERGINNLQEQLERIEREAKEEREHHVEMMNRIERQRDMEKELNMAAGRLKGAAAAKSINPGGNNVVGHFVRDLLQDNANLQYAIAELRELLLTSNDEIQALRNQLECHQPLADDEDSTMPTLSAELDVKNSHAQEPRSPTKVSQELHIHHHYHVSTPKPEVRKARKKRLGLTTGTVPSPALCHSNTPTHGLMMRHSSAPHSRKNSIRSNRWSSISEQPSELTLSSTPSSPRSNYRSSVFDPPAGSFPESPTSSVDPMSPDWRPAHRKQVSGMSARSFQVPTCFPFGPAPPTIAHPIVEESSDGTEIPTEIISTMDTSVTDDEASLRSLGAANDGYPPSPSETTDSDYPPNTRYLRRTLSHESIVSLSGGLDIHTLRSRPSQLTIGQLGSASSVTGSSIVTARPMLSVSGSKRSSALLRDSFGSFPVGSLRSHSSDASSQQQQPQRDESSKLGKWVGWRLWGGSEISASTDSSQRSVSAQPVIEKDAAKTSSRPPGVNQPGSIPGFSEYLAASAKKKAPAIKTTPDVVDSEALREGLSE
ncbi:hypothetical protein F5B22DRAFT_235186 [Xylaria bambusicola]|uniref:uncharacterized protein n=1 Tax=Xylaria bambusicola TaxID=326684 RepID=UPI002008C44E|nr:uncharacterized protein F5B22DRAFT_235186 [Xylaria bambusicola]KAI0514601.1 hypothetical protein F5B22DRAFT_235186 [Xylaria bambusicola]